MNIFSSSRWVPYKRILLYKTFITGNLVIFNSLMPIIIYYIENTKLVLNIAQVHPARLRKSKIMRLANYPITSATSTMYLGPDLVTPVAYRWWHLLVQLVEPHKTKHWRRGTASLHTEVCVWSVGAPVSVRVSLG